MRVNVSVSVVGEDVIHLILTAEIVGSSYSS